MNENTAQSNGSIGFVGLLTIVLITLKLTGHIDWSWIWVLSPLWLGAAVGIAIFGALTLFVVIGAVIEVYKKNREF